MPHEDGFVVDLERMRAVYEEDRGALARAADPEQPSITRVVVRIVQDVALEARTGKFILHSDEPQERGGSGTAPTPLMYFSAGIGT